MFLLIVDAIGSDGIVNDNNIYVSFNLNRWYS